MSIASGQSRASRHLKAGAAQRLLSGDEVKTRLHERGETVKSWALKNGFKYATVSHVIRGLNRGNYGLGHRIAVALGMKEAA